MPSPGFDGVDARVGHQLDPGANDAVGLPIEDDRPIHLRELTECRRRVHHVKRESAGRDLRDDFVPAEHD
jgi:hypothetical protein